MKRYAVAIGLFFVVIAVMALAAIPATISTNLAKAKIVEHIKGWTGGAVALRGEPVITVFPAVEVEVQDIVVSGLGSEDQPFLVVPSLKASLKILPLLTGQVEVETLTLVEPRIHLLTDETGNGTGNGYANRLWSAAAQKAATTGVRFGEIVLKNGTITYENRDNGRTDKVTNANLRFRWEDVTQGIEFSSAFVWRGKTVEIDAELESLFAVLDGTGSWGRLTLAAAPSQFSAQQALYRPASENGGESEEINRLRPSLWRVAQWLNLPIAPASALGPLRIAGTFAAGRSSIGLSQATLDLNGSSAEGNLTLQLAGVRPQLHGSLAFDELDLRLFAAALPTNTTLAELLARPLSAIWLSRADLDLLLSAEEIDLGGSQITDAFMTLFLQDGQMALTLSEADLGGGHMQANVATKPVGKGIGTHLSARLDDVSVSDAGRFIWAARANPLITTAMPFLGTGSARLELSAEGASIGEMLGSLSGQLVADMRDGTVDGVDLASTLGRLTGGNTVIAKGEAPFMPVIGRTSFSTLTAHATIEAGIARAKRIHIVGDQFEVTFSGEWDIKRREIGAQGTASLLTAESDDGNDRLRPLVELPFGVGGTVIDPMVEPGIPRIEDPMQNKETYLPGHIKSGSIRSGQLQQQKKNLPTSLASLSRAPPIGVIRVAPQQ